VVRILYHTLNGVLKLGALATRLFRPSSHVGLVWERGAGVLHLDPLEVVDGRERRLSGCTRCDKNRQELHADSFFGREGVGIAEVVVLCVSGLGARARGRAPHLTR
jgi:hypothetical protein